MRAIEKLLTLALIAGPCLAQFQVNTIRRGAECKSNDVWLGKYDNMAGCAGACADRKDEGCRFFIYGHAESRKAGDCYMEFTESKCEVEGFEEDSFDFLQLTADWIGCTEPRAPNFNAYATTDDGSCLEANTCHEKQPGGGCRNCKDGLGCTESNKGYRNREFDTVVASKVAQVTP